MKLIYFKIDIPSDGIVLDIGGCWGYIDEKLIIY